MNSLPGPRQGSPSENSPAGHPFLLPLPASPSLSLDPYESSSSDDVISLIGREEPRNVSIEQSRCPLSLVCKLPDREHASKKVSNFVNFVGCPANSDEPKKWQLFLETKKGGQDLIGSSPLLGQIEDSQSILATTENPRSSRGSFSDRNKDSTLPSNPLFSSDDLKKCYNFERRGSKQTREKSVESKTFCIEKAKSHHRPELIKLLKALVVSQEEFELALANFEAQGIESVLVKNWIRENYFEKKNMGAFAQLEKILELPFDQAMKAFVDAKLLLKCRQKRPSCALKSLMVLLLSKTRQPKISNHFSQFPGTDRLSEKHILHLIGQEPLRSKLQIELANPHQIFTYCLNEFERKFEHKIRLWITNAVTAYLQAEFFPDSAWRLRFRMKMRMRLVPIDISPSLDKLKALMGSQLPLNAAEKKATLGPGLEGK